MNKEPAICFPRVFFKVLIKHNKKSRRNSRGDVDILFGPGVQDALRPGSKGSVLTECMCRVTSSGPIAPCPLEEAGPSSRPVASGGLRSDMSASTLKGRRGTCAARLFGHGGRAPPSGAKPSSPGEDITLRHGVQTCGVLTESTSDVSCQKVDKSWSWRKTPGGTRDPQSTVRPDPGGWGRTLVIGPRIFGEASDGVASVPHPPARQQVSSAPFSSD